MANSSIEEKEFKRLRVRVEGLKMSEKAKADFFQSEWNRLCENKEKEKERQAMLEEKERNRELELERLKFESKQREMEFEERKMQMEVKRLKLERKADRSAGKGEKQTRRGACVLLLEE